MENWGVKQPDPYTGHVPSCSRCGEPAYIMIGEEAFCRECADEELELVL